MTGKYQFKCKADTGLKLNGELKQAVATKRDATKQHNTKAETKTHHEYINTTIQNRTETTTRKQKQKWMQYE